MTIFSYFLKAKIQTYFNDTVNITINSKIFATIGDNSIMRLLEIYRKAPDLDLIVNEESNTNSQYFKSYAAVRIIRLRMYLSITGLVVRVTHFNKWSFNLSLIKIIAFGRSFYQPSNMITVWLG